MSYPDTSSLGLTLVDAITKFGSRQLFAVNVMPTLRECVAVLTGGSDKRGGPILTIPDVQRRDVLSSSEFANLIRYLFSLPSDESKCRLFSVIIDMRKSTWNSIKPILNFLNDDECASIIHTTFIIKPENFWQKQKTSIASQKYRFETHMLSIDGLHKVVDSSQLTHDLDGSLVYDHQSWIQSRCAVEEFIEKGYSLMEQFLSLENEIRSISEQCDQECLKDVQCALQRHNFVSEQIRVVLDSQLYERASQILHAIIESLSGRPPTNKSYHGCEDIHSIFRMKESSILFNVILTYITTGESQSLKSWISSNRTSARPSVEEVRNLVLAVWRHDAREEDGLTLEMMMDVIQMGCSVRLAKSSIIHSSNSKREHLLHCLRWINFSTQANKVCEWIECTRKQFSKCELSLGLSENDTCCLRDDNTALSAHAQAGRSDVQTLISDGSRMIESNHFASSRITPLIRRVENVWMELTALLNYKANILNDVIDLHRHIITYERKTSSWKCELTASSPSPPQVHQGSNQERISALEKELSRSDSIQREMRDYAEITICDKLWLKCILHRFKHLHAHLKFVQTIKFSKSKNEINGQIHQVGIVDGEWWMSLHIDHLQTHCPCSFMSSSSNNTASSCSFISSSLSDMDKMDWHDLNGDDDIIRIHVILMSRVKNCHDTLLQVSHAKRIKCQQRLALALFEDDVKQVLDWLRDHGEVFLARNTGVGRNLGKARQYQKSHQTFEQVAQNTYVNAEKLLSAASELSVSGGGGGGSGSDGSEIQVASKLQSHINAFASKVQDRRNVILLAISFYTHSDQLSTWIDDLRCQYKVVSRNQSPTTNYVTLCLWSLASSTRLPSSDNISSNPSQSQSPSLLNDLNSQKEWTNDAFHTTFHEGKTLIHNLKMQGVTVEKDQSGSCAGIQSTLDKLNSLKIDADRLWIVQKRKILIILDIITFKQNASQLTKEIQNLCTISDSSSSCGMIEKSSSNNIIGGVRNGDLDLDSLGGIKGCRSKLSNLIDSISKVRSNVSNLQQFSNNLLRAIDEYNNEERRMISSNQQKTKKDDMITMDDCNNSDLMFGIDTESGVKIEQTVRDVDIRLSHANELSTQRRLCLTYLLHASQFHKDASQVITWIDGAEKMLISTFKIPQSYSQAEELKVEHQQFQSAIEKTHVFATHVRQRGENLIENMNSCKEQNVASTSSSSKFSESNIRCLKDDITHRWQTLYSRAEERFKLVSASLNFYKTASQVCSVLENLERDYRKEELEQSVKMEVERSIGVNIHGSDITSRIHDILSNINSRITKHQEQKEAFLKACTLARRTAETFLKYSNRSITCFTKLKQQQQNGNMVNNCDVIPLKTPESRVKDILDDLLSHENGVLELWTMKKGRFEQSQQFILFARSSSQLLKWIVNEGMCYLKSNSSHAINKHQASALAKNVEEVRQRVKMLSTLAQSLIDSPSDRKKSSASAFRNVSGENVSSLNNQHVHSKCISIWVDEINSTFISFQAMFESSRMTSLPPSSLSSTPRSSSSLITTDTDSGIINPSSVDGLSMDSRSVNMSSTQSCTSTSNTSLSDERLTSVVNDVTVDNDSQNLPKLETSKYQRRLNFIMCELLDSERCYVKDLEVVVNVYLSSMRDASSNLSSSNQSNSTNIPILLRNKESVVFANIEQILTFHRDTFLRELEKYRDRPEDVGHCFVTWASKFDIYVSYCTNKPQSSELVVRKENQIYFDSIQKMNNLDHPISAYLIKPVQRITKYQLLLKDMLSTLNSEGFRFSEIKEGLNVCLSVPRKANDAMHLSMVEMDNVDEMGEIVLQELMQIVDNKQMMLRKVKERRIFLFDLYLLITKEVKDSNGKKAKYVFKSKYMINEIVVTEYSTDEEECKFTITHRTSSSSSDENKFTLKVSSVEVKRQWVKSIGELTQATLLSVANASTRQNHQQQQQQTSSGSDEFCLNPPTSTSSTTAGSAPHVESGSGGLPRTTSTSSSLTTVSSSVHEEDCSHQNSTLENGRDLQQSSLQSSERGVGSSSYKRLSDSVIECNGSSTKSGNGKSLLSHDDHLYTYSSSSTSNQSSMLYERTVNPILSNRDEVSVVTDAKQPNEVVDEFETTTDGGDRSLNHNSHSHDPEDTNSQNALPKKKSFSSKWLPPFRKLSVTSPNPLVGGSSASQQRTSSILESSVNIQLKSSANPIHSLTSPTTCPDLVSVGMEREGVSSVGFGKDCEDFNNTTTLNNRNKVECGDDCGEPLPPPMKPMKNIPHSTSKRASSTYHPHSSSSVLILNSSVSSDSTRKGDSFNATVGEQVKSNSTLTMDKSDKPDEAQLSKITAGMKELNTVSSNSKSVETVANESKTEVSSPTVIPDASSPLLQRSYRLEELGESEHTYVSDLALAIQYMKIMNVSKQNATSTTNSSSHPASASSSSTDHSSSISQNASSSSQSDNLANNCSIVMPEGLRDGKDRMIFGNIQAMYEWHRDFFLGNLEKCVKSPVDLGKLFMKYERKFQMYVVYCQNKPKSEFIVAEYIDTYFEQIRLHLKTKLRITDLLIKPIQRLTKYHMLLEAILKYTKRAAISHTSEVEEGEVESLTRAYNVMTVVPNMANEMMDIGRLQGFSGKITAQGKLLHRGPLNCADLLHGDGTGHDTHSLGASGSGSTSYSSHNSLKMRPFTVFLFEQIILFSETVGKKSQFTSPVYIYKAHFLLNKMILEEGVVESDDPNETHFVIQSNDPARHEMRFLCQASDSETKETWISIIKRQLQSQLDFLAALQAPIAYHTKAATKH